jgi:ATP-binding cassette, subfamily B, bacterial PglK
VALLELVVHGPNVDRARVRSSNAGEHAARLSPEFGVKALLAVWRILDKRQRHRLLALHFLSVLMAFSTVGGMAAILPFFTELSEPHSLRSPLLRTLHAYLHLHTEGGFLVALGVVFVAAVLLSNLVNLLGTLAINKFAFAVGDALHTRLFSEYLHRGYAFHLQTSIATLSNNVIHETSRVASGILRNGLILSANLVAFLFIVGSILLVNPEAAMLVIAGLVASYSGIYLTVRSRLLRNGRTQSETFTERARIVSESFGAVKELIMLRAQTHFVTKLSRCCRALSRTIVSTLAITQTPRNALECVTACVLVGAALYSRRIGAADGSWIAQLSFLGMAIYRLLATLQQIFLAIVTIRADSPAFDLIAGDLCRVPEQKRAGSPDGGDGSWHDRPLREIRLRHVTFSHVADRAPAIVDISLDLPAGKIIGFVGANGSGKTTLIDLIAGLLVPQSGRIEIDGRALEPCGREAWQSVIAYVPQNIFICDATLAENVALGHSLDTIDFDRLRDVIRLAQLDQCVAGLRHGYEERLGQHGARLSGGQRQRLGIARALYRDASLLIMDEATSSLDITAEFELTVMLARHLPDRTVLIVAHRLSALRHCDLIHELAGGRIVRSATYEQWSLQTGRNVVEPVGELRSASAIR